MGRRGETSSGRAALAVLLLALLPGGAAAATDPEPGAAAGSDGTGSIAGTVLVGEQLASRRMRFSIYPDTARTGPAPGGDPVIQELANVVIYLVAVPEGREPTGRRLVPPAMRQEEHAFVPHVLPIVKGTTVQFPNDDPVYHNVFSLSKAATFDLGRYPRGSSRSVVLPTPGVVKVFCHLHADMSAVILVLDNPYFTSPSPDGRYAIDGIPAGQYEVVAWHERAKPQRRQVRVAAGDVAEADFNIPLADTDRDE